MERQGLHPSGGGNGSDKSGDPALSILAMFGPHCLQTKDSQVDALGSLGLAMSVSPPGAVTTVVLTLPCHPLPPGIRRCFLPLLVAVRRSRGVRGRGGGVSPAAASHHGAAAGHRGYPEELGRPPAHLPGRGTGEHARQQPDSDPGCLAPRRGGGSRLP